MSLVDNSFTYIIRSADAKLIDLGEKSGNCTILLNCPPMYPFYEVEVTIFNLILFLSISLYLFFERGLNK